MNFIDRWKELQASQTLIQIIQNFRIPFNAKVPLIIPNLLNHHFQTPKSPTMDRVINQMLQENVLEPVALSPSFVSQIFLIPKRDRTFRPIFNLKNLNFFVTVRKFRLINVQKISNFLQPRDWLVKIDLLNAYFHLSVTEKHRRFLRLIYDQKLYQMTCLPFGLACAPKTFAMLTNWIAQLLRDRGIRVIVYLDDFLLANQDPLELVRQAQKTVSLLEYLGWKVNYPKSTLTPQKEMQYLGIMWNAHANRKYLPQQKRRDIHRKVSALLERKNASLRQLQGIVGMLNFASFPVPRGRLNHRNLLQQCRALLQLNPRVSVRYRIPTLALKELKWWQTNVGRSTPIFAPKIAHYLVTDASGIGWGAQLDSLRLWGQWTLQETKLHSNVREMLAIWYVLKDQAQRLADSTVLIQSDNKTVVSYIRNEGGMKSLALLNLTRQVISVLDMYKIHVKIHYLPGPYNGEADRLSRLSGPPEWHLTPIVTNVIFFKFGVPVIDLFASAAAHVVPNYATLDIMDKKACLYDAFSQNWDYPLAWVFPPPFLMPRVLQHLNSAKGIFLIVAPRWNKVFWRPDLKNRALEAPFAIRHLDQCLIDATTGHPPFKVSEMSLEVWRCGGGLKA